MARIDGGVPVLSFPVPVADAGVADAAVKVDGGAPPQPANRPVTDQFDASVGGRADAGLTWGSAPDGGWQGPTLSASQLLRNPQAAQRALDGGTAAASTPPQLLTERITFETTPSKAPEGMREVHVNVPWISQYDPTVELRNQWGKVIPTEWPAQPDGGVPKGSPRDVACASAALEMMTRSGVALSGQNINVADAKDSAGRIRPNPERAAQARTYIDGQLEGGKPVLVGVMWNTPKPGLNGGQADHFVVITGRGADENGNVFYTFNEPGVSAGNSAIGSDSRKENRFYVDQATGELYRPAGRYPGYEANARLEVSRVSINK